MSYQPNPVKQLFHQTRRFLAKHWLSRQSAIQIAITGSQGKTNTTQLIAQCLSTIGSTTVTDIDLDTKYNLPITALKVMPWTKFAVFEVGIDQKGEMDLHRQIIKPKIAVITGISLVHTDREHLGSLQNLIKEKRKSIESLLKDSYAILNFDDENVRNMASYTKAKVLFFGTDRKTCHVWADNIHVSLDGTSFNLHEKKITSTWEIKTKLIGQHHVYNLMAAYLVFKLLVPKDITNDIMINRFIEIVKHVRPLPGRMSVETGPFGTTVINDSLRANPISTAFGLTTLSEIDYKKGKKIAVLAEMGELQYPQQEHEKIGHLISQLKINVLIAIGPMQKYTVQTALENKMKKDNVFWVKDVFAAALVLKKIIKKGDLIYLKGSLLRHVERVTIILAGKKVNCTTITCPFYHHCSRCQYLVTGYQNSNL